MNKYNFTLSKEDFLRFLLFTASKSKRTRNKRIRSWLLLTVSFFLLGVVLSDNEDRFLSYYFYSISSITLIFYPFYNSWYYKRHYRKHIEEHYGNKIGIEIELSFDDEYLYSKDSMSEGKLKLSEIEKINEIPENIFIKIKTGDTLIVPKSSNNFQNLQDEIKTATTVRNIKWNNELKWKWR